jgi:hypothetical protein
VQLYNSQTGVLSWGAGGIDTSANYSGAGTGNAGDVVIRTGGAVYGGKITANAVNTAGGGNGGAVLITSGDNLSVGVIDTSAYSVGATGGIGGLVALTSSGSAISLGGVNSAGHDQGGAITILSQGGVSAGVLDAHSASIGGTVRAEATSTIALAGIDTSASTSSNLYHRRFGAFRHQDLSHI